jgi:histidinol phosphatase-like enzyme
MNTAEDMTGSALFLDRDGVINVDRGRFAAAAADRCSGRERFNT